MARSTLIALLLSASAARAGQTWIFEPGQALVSVEVGPRAARLSAVSLSLNGQFVEQDAGLVTAALRLDLDSFATGKGARDAQLREAADAAAFPSITFDGTAPGGSEDGKLHFTGTLTVRGVAHPLELTVATVRMGSTLYGHASFSIHLRDLGIALPAGVPDDAHVNVDAGLRPERGTVASRF